MAIQRQGVGSQFVVPESMIEPALQFTRLCCELRTYLRLAEVLGQHGDRLFRRINVALHLAERNRRFGESAIFMKDGILRIFPALLR